MEQLGAEHARAPVPVVDIEDPGATAAVRAACKDHGFFYGMKNLEDAQASRDGGPFRCTMLGEWALPGPRNFEINCS